MSLTDPRWTTLRHAFGSGDEKADLLLELAEDPVAAYAKTGEEPTAWENLVDCIFHQGSVYSTTLAAFPFLLMLAKKNPDFGQEVVAFARTLVELGGLEDLVRDPENTTEEMRALFCRAVLQLVDPPNERVAHRK